MTCSYPMTMFSRLPHPFGFDFLERFRLSCSSSRLDAIAASVGDLSGQLKPLADFHPLLGLWWTENKKGKFPQAEELRSIDQG